MNDLLSEKPGAGDNGAEKVRSARKTPDQIERETIEKAFAEKVTINVAVDASDSGRDDLFVRVCGRSFLIRRGEDVQVPRPVVEVLRNAVEDTYVCKTDKNTGKEMFIKKSAPAYPFSVRG